VTYTQYGNAEVVPMVDIRPRPSQGGAYGAFGVFGAIFRGLAWKTPTLYGIAVPQTPNAS
jgi:hypothetical protein